MNSGLQQGFILGQSSGLGSGLRQGLQSGFTMTNRFNSLNPSNILDPKLKPVFYINADNVALTSGAVSITYNLIDNTPNQLFPKIENIFEQTAGLTYRPPLVVGGLNGRNYMNFADSSNRYLASNTTLTNVYKYASASPNPAVSGTGMTYMFVIKRKLGGTFCILDGRDSSTLATTNDLTLDVDSAGRIVFSYVGGIAGSTTTLNGTAGVNLLNQWSILTVKCQLRIDGGDIPSDSDTPSGTPATKRFAKASGSRIGATSAIDIFVNGVEQQKTTTGSFTNADHYGDTSFRMFDRDIWLGNKGTVFATSGTNMAAALMIPSYIDKALQQRIENYFRNYYSLPF